MDSTALADLLRYQLKLVDLSIDIDRNMADSEAQLAIRPTETVYVFDSNVFELFIDPLDERGEQLSLHSEAWLKMCGITDPEELGRLKAIVPQTALLTTEYLFSTRFPRSGDSYIYMTEWHFYEYARRLTELTRTLWKSSVSDQRDPKTRFKQIREAKAFLDNPSEDLTSKLAELDALLSQDVDNLLNLGLLKPAELNPFVANRLLLNVLCHDNELEKIDQINRLLETAISQRIRLLPRKYHIRQDRSRFDAHASVWEVRLRRERMKDKKKARRPEALADDAKSLAHVEWAAEAAEDLDERLVFITADDLIFDAYRRWYTDLKLDDAIRPPFVVRRLAQYAPLYNMADSSNALGDNVKGLFYKVRMLLKTALVPLMLTIDRGLGLAKNLAPSQRKTAASLYLKEPQNLIEVETFKALTEVMRKEDSSQKRAALDRIMAELRLVERTTLGLADEYVRARLDEWERALPEINQPHPEVYEQAFRTYIQAKIQTAIESSRHFSLPLALRFIKDWRLEKHDVRPRAPIVFMGKLAGSTETNLAAILNQSLSQARAALPITDDQWEVIGADPAATFSMAGWLCLVSEKWAEAEQYADLCLMWAKANAMPPTSVHTVEQAEYYFLCAVTKRFKIGSTGPTARLDTQTAIARQFKEAAGLLTVCIEFHSERAALDIEEALRTVRAESELAALNLFYAATLIPKVGAALGLRPPDVDMRGDQLKIVSEALDQADKLLDSCLSKLAGFPFLGEGQESTLKVLKRVKAQVAVNYAATFCLRLLCRQDIPLVPALRSSHVDKFVTEILVAFTKPDGPTSAPLLREELLLYASFSGLELPHGINLKTEIPDDIQFTLRLDRALYLSLTEVREDLPISLG
ncbi:hypothetical protein [Asticcacaulis excentricus]|uniref:PIN domain-containing protein n=1 Tax=Asticcacaulis excentricus TaxID=78587 RepID=A0A3G9GB97_9CAUL|nr:hypothetical protein [Asticcacaulis excentricus]BBF82623.1 hypothetical protein EM6_3264 [Asticcacaulis excentricus]